MNIELFAEVLLPLAVEGSYTYSVPDNLVSEIKIGCRVAVSLGKNKYYTGIVTDLHENKPTGFDIKPVLHLVDSLPFVEKLHLDFWQWIASYYMCSRGEVMKAAIPSGFRPDSLDLEELKSSGKKAITCVRLKSEYSESKNAIDVAIKLLSRSKHQTKLMYDYLDLSGYLENETEVRIVARKDLLDFSGESSEVLKALFVKGIVELYDMPFNDEPESTDSYFLRPLNDAQNEALMSVKANFTQKQVCLLHGYTSSGKTEIYIHLISEYLSKGKQVLFLVPEIALTTQLFERMKAVFGNDVLVYHSGLRDSYKMSVWNTLSENKAPKLVLGARSSVFLPFKDLGLIIVDEEHESSYKQQDPAPRYNARNASMVLASMFNACTLLGTATPSIEAYSNCLMGKSGLTELFVRYKDSELPEIIVVDVKELRRKKIMKSLFSPVLLENINMSLQNREKVILFQNRRGYSPFVQCSSCGWIPKCKYCDVSMTFHKKKNRLSCHYCGYELSMPEACPECGGNNVKTGSPGTEKIEEEISKKFPGASVARLDTDTTRTKNSFENILYNFDTGDTNILIGTQMVSKGLDFKGVRVAGIINADQLLNFPDFRAHERAFQLLTQVSGRAGRLGERGIVIIQTSQPENPVLKYVLKNDFMSFFNTETAIRKDFSYPPFTRIISITLKHTDAAIVRRAALKYAGMCRKYFNGNLLGPDIPVVSRINNYYMQNMLLKADITTSFIKTKEVLLSLKDEIKQNSDFKQVQFVFDVDPV